jgi:hypothetical protein
MGWRRWGPKGRDAPPFDLRLMTICLFFFYAGAAFDFAASRKGQAVCLDLGFSLHHWPFIV